MPAAGRPDCPSGVCSRPITAQAVRMWTFCVPRSLSGRDPGYFSAGPPGAGGRCRLLVAEFGGPGLQEEDEQGNVLHGVSAVAEAVPLWPLGLGAAGEIGGAGPERCLAWAIDPCQQFPPLPAVP